jgi:hypothetical protein
MRADVGRSILAGLVLIVEDGDYANAIIGADLAPFTTSQTDLGCRNREPRTKNGHRVAADAIQTTFAPMSIREPCQDRPDSHPDCEACGPLHEDR